MLPRRFVDPLMIDTEVIDKLAVHVDRCVQLINGNPFTFGVCLGNVAWAEDDELHEFLEDRGFCAKGHGFGSR